MLSEHNHLAAFANSIHSFTAHNTCLVLSLSIDGSVLVGSIGERPNNTSVAHTLVPCYHHSQTLLSKQDRTKYGVPCGGLSDPHLDKRKGTLLATRGDRLTDLRQFCPLNGN